MGLYNEGILLIAIHCEHISAEGHTDEISQLVKA